MVGERLKKRFDRRPIWRKAEDQIKNPGHNLRNRVSGSIGNRVPRFENRNFGGGIGVGVVSAAVATILEDTVGLPFGGSADVMGVRPAQDGQGNVYTVNVNAPTEDMAKARAFIDAGTGFTSLLTDTLRVREVEILDKRTVRDTYQIELRIID